MRPLTTVFSFLLITLLLSSCATYHMSTQSLMEQFAYSHQEKKLTILIMPPFFFFPGIVRGNSLRQVHVLDKHEQLHTMYVTNRTGIKITKTNGRHKIFYFNTLLLQDSTIAGSKTHFFNAPIHPIKLSEISKIELQN